MNSLTLRLFPLLFACAGAGEPTWDSLKFPLDPTPQSVGLYLREVRVLTNPVLKPQSNLPPSWRPPHVSAEILERATVAMHAVPVERLELVLGECKNAEKEWAKSQIEIWIQSPDRGKELIGFDSVSLRFRTPFTQLAINHVIRLPEIPAPLRKILFEHLGTFPELIAAVARRAWLMEMDPYVSVALMKRIDQVGWRNTAPYWIDSLLRMDSPAAWRAIEYLMVNCEVAVQVAAYRAVKAVPTPKLDLPSTVTKAWRIYKLDVGKGHPTIYAPIAAEYGIADAVVAMANCIRDEHVPQAPQQWGPVLVSFLRPQFSDARQAAAFVAANWDRLVFDPRTKKYDVKRPPSPHATKAQ
jgi:hypothetical protein